VSLDELDDEDVFKMIDKAHQTSHHGYQIRVDGTPVYWPSMMCSETIEKWAVICAENPSCYVDVVRVSTEILFSQFEYNQIKKHFDS